MNPEEIGRDPFIKSLYDEAGTEKPSKNFTDRIIKNIKAESKVSAFTYKPVISRTAWRIIAVVGFIAFIFLLLVPNGEGQGLGLDLHGYSLNIDTTKIKGMLSKFAFSFEFTPIMKTSFLALIIFTFSNLIIFELKNRSFFK